MANKKSWISQIFKGKDTTQKGYNNAFSWQGIGYTPKFSSFGKDILASDLILESIRLKADFISKLEPRHVRNNNGTQTLADSSIARVLARPNQHQTTRDFFRQAAFLHFAVHNCFIYPDYEIRNGQRYYTSMHVLQPTEWKYLEDEDGTLYISFKFKDNSNDVVFPYSDIIHWKHNQEDDTYDGGGNYAKMGDTYLLNTLQAYRSLCESVAEAAKISCYFDGILKINAFGQDNAKIQAIRDDFVNDIKRNGSKIPVLDNGAEWQELKRNLALVDPNTLTFFQSYILRHEGTSLAMLSGDYTSAQKDAFYDRCIEAEVIGLGQAFSKCVFTQWQETHGDSIIFYPNKIELMSNSEKVALLTATNAMGVWSINEIRDMFGKPPVEGGDARPRGYNSLDGGTAAATGANAEPHDMQAIADKVDKVDDKTEKQIVSDTEQVVKQPLMVGQLQALTVIIADYQAGKYTYNQACNMLVIGVGISKEEAEQLLDKQEDEIKQ